MMNKMIWITLFMLILLTNMMHVQAQEVLLENETEDLYDVPKTGKNRQKYSHFYGSYGAHVQIEPTEGLKTNPLLSYQFQLGFRQKFKISGFYAMGFDYAITWDRYRIVQDDANIFPDNVTHKKEMFGQNALKLGYYNRFNFDFKRGDHIGKYLDLGIWGNWVFVSKYVQWDEYENAVNGATRSKTTFRGINFDEPFQWGVQARLGFNRYVLFGSYRMSETFKEAYKDLDPGRLLIGIELSAF